MLLLTFALAFVVSMAGMLATIADDEAYNEFKKKYGTFIHAYATDLVIFYMEYTRRKHGRPGMWLYVLATGFGALLLFIVARLIENLPAMVWWIRNN